MSKNGENIYKRRGSRREVRYSNGCRRSNCRKKYGHGYGKTHLKALTEVDAPVIHCERKHFSHYCDEWLQLNRSRVKESPYVKYNGILSKPRLGKYLVGAITTVIQVRILHLRNMYTHLWSLNGAI